jgi:hypothetical protein
MLVLVNSHFDSVESCFDRVKSGFDWVKLRFDYVKPRVLRTRLHRREIDLEGETSINSS